VADEDFPAFFRREFPRLVVYLRLWGFARQAEDAAAEAMHDAFAKWDDISKPAAWVRTVALRSAIADVDSGSRRTAREERYARSVLAAEVSDPHVASELGEEQCAVLSRLRDMPPKRRAVVALVYDGYPVCEIAEALNMEEPTVRSHLRHARTALDSTGQTGGAI
jgi:RNA polymerase sigma factor (sigma-70 family)